MRTFADNHAPGYLTARPSDAARLMSSRSAVVLVGGFDGSANYGDILQARAALARTTRAATFATVAIVVEDEYAEYALTALSAPTDTVILRFSEEPADGSLTQLPDLSLTYLYGGGYINESWSRRRLRHFNTVVSLVAHRDLDASPRVAATGLQISPHEDLWAWIPWLGSAEPMGVRDGASADALIEAGIDRARIIDSGDDACETLLSHGPFAGSDKRCVNIHLSTREYATVDPQGRLTWLTSALSALGAALPGLRCNLIVAYDDRRISEFEICREVVSRYNEVQVARDSAAIEFQTLSLIDELAVDNRVELGALATITSSYHVGLASLLAGIPTVLLAENAFYQQKMSALAGAFGLGDDAVISPADCPPDTIGVVIERISKSLTATHATAVELMRSRSYAATEAVGHTVSRLDRDMLWADSRALFTHYGQLVEEVADLRERKRYLELQALDEVANRAVSASAEPDEPHLATPASRRIFRRARPA